jgi:para-nitrobenzyl esterase
VSGNYGILDQIAALGWLRRNAAAFGADPARILIFGESAGAVDVCALVASPLAKGLFASALMQSGGCGQETLAKVEAFGNTIVQAAGCGGAADPGACLRGLPAPAIVSAVPGLANVVSSSGQLYGPNVDGWLLRDSPMTALTNGTHNHVPFVVGANADETSAYAPALASEAQYQAAIVAQFGALHGALVLNRYPASAYATPTKAYVAVTTDARFVCPARRIARAARASQAESVFRYFFTHALDSGAKRALGAYHGLELPFVFRTLTDVPGFVPSQLELGLADAMGGYWSRLAASGDPNGAGAVSWPSYEVASDPVIQLDGVVTPAFGVRTANCDFWDTFIAP